MNRLIMNVSALLMAFCAGSVAAGGTGGSTPEAQVRAAIAATLPGMKVGNIEPGPIKGLDEVTIGSRVVYVTKDGRYLITGDIYDMHAGAAITQDRERQLKRKLLADLNNKDMIVYGSSRLPYTITVFSDIDCGYCRMLHGQIPEYNKLGIRVRYLAFPRAGLNSLSARKAVSVWCAPDPNKAMDRAMDALPVPQRQCAHNPVATDYRLGREFGVTATPTIMFSDGAIVPGYIPPQRLAGLLRQMSADSGSSRQD